MREERDRRQRNGQIWQLSDGRRASAAPWRVRRLESLQTSVIAFPRGGAFVATLTSVGFVEMEEKVGGVPLTPTFVCLFIQHQNIE